jgi:hypothetical protein
MLHEARPVNRKKSKIFYLHAQITDKFIEADKFKNFFAVVSAQG